MKKLNGREVTNVLITLELIGNEEQSAADSPNSHWMMGALTRMIVETSKQGIRQTCACEINPIWWSYLYCVCQRTAIFRNMSRDLMCYGMHRNHEMLKILCEFVKLRCLLLESSEEFSFRFSNPPDFAGWGFNMIPPDNWLATTPPIFCWQVSCSIDHK